MEKLKGQLVGYAHKIAFREWVANHDGNLSARLTETEFLATPTAVHKGEIDHGMLLVVDLDGTVKQGERKVFSEWELHRAIYAARPDVQAVIHAHPPYATACACAGICFDTPIMVEPVVSLGPVIPLVPFFRPKDVTGLAKLSELATSADVLMLENHGVIAFGPTLETAYLRLELVEHQAKIRTIAQSWGGARALPDAAPGNDMRGTIARIVAEELARA